MKTIITLIALTVALSANAQEFNLRFWDGTFAYNELIVKSAPHQNNIASFELKGSQLNLGSLIEGNPQTWSLRDRVTFSLQKSACKIDTETPFVQCADEKVFVRLSWTINNKISKSYEGLVTNLKVLGSKQVVSVSFTIPSDEQFAPLNEDINVTFFSSHF
ncbi:MAG: hypothetical protein NXH75_00785 [Halobacteriovoraceae bacterium]|nr:hypothetical protein [Halobacteriovoraceae bacterium]